MTRRVVVVGLDGLDPSIVHELLPELPNLRRIMDAGVFGPLESIPQPATPPAWTAMTTGLNPGHFGFTDFLVSRAEPGGEGPRLALVHSGLVRVPTLFDLADEAGLRTFALSVPVSYPAPRRRYGAAISCFLAPSLTRRAVEPPVGTETWRAALGRDFVLDVTAADDVEDRSQLRSRLRMFDDQRFDLLCALVEEDAWELVFGVCMGTDRVAHLLLEDARDGGEAVADHYRHCDARLGELLERVPGDAVVIVVSDHGVQPLAGRLDLNRWLVSLGLLVLDEPVAATTPLAAAPIAWDRTTAWSCGFGGQIHLKRRGRLGCSGIDDAAADRLAEEIAAEARQLRGPTGEPLAVETFLCNEVYDGPYARDCPDVSLRIEGLRYLTRNAIGSDGLWAASDDGDRASHATHGFFAMAGADVPAVGLCRGLGIYDIAPTILDLLGVELPEVLDGRSLLEDIEAPLAPADEHVLATRLTRMYLQ